MESKLFIFDDIIKKNTASRDLTAVGLEIP